MSPTATAPDTPKPQDVTTIPDWVEKLGGVHEFCPRPASNLRLLITGAPKSGKSSFVASIPRSCHIDFEGGAHSIAGRRGQMFYVPAVRESDLPKTASGSTWVRQKPVAFEGLLAKLVADAATGSPYFQHIVFDTIDAWYEMTLKYLEKHKWKKDIDKYKGGKGGWSEVAGNIMETLRMLDAAGYGWTVIAHLKKEVEVIAGVPTSQIRPAVPPSMYGPLTRDADYMIHAQVISAGKAMNPDSGKPQMSRSYELVVASPEKRREDFVQGGRIALPDILTRIPMIGGWDTFEREYNTAVQRHRRIEASTNK